MIKNTKISQKVKHFYEIFDKRTYNTFKMVISSIIFLRSPKQADIANFSKKTLSQIQYFFAKSKWSFSLLNKLRLQWIRNKILGAGDKKSDILLLDSTIMSKSKNSKFSGLVNFFFSNKDKKIVNGFDIFGASIITKNGFRYILDICFYFKKDKLKLTSKDKRNPSIQNNLWMKFISKLLKQTKSWLVVMDSGFKGGYICKWIYNILKRQFLVRISEGQLFYDKYGNKLKIEEMLKNENAITLNGNNLWVFKKVKLNSWIKKGIHLEVNIIVYYQKAFRKPFVLCTSANIEDIYENMIREKGEPSWNQKLKTFCGEKTITKISEENKIYFSFILLYQKRWSIEVCFRELKTYLGFEKSQVQSYEGIMKYFHICILVHTLLHITLEYVKLNFNIKNYIYQDLKEKRNIKNKSFNISFDGIKLFFEMSIFNSSSISFDNINFSISFKSSFSLFYQ